MATNVCFIKGATCGIGARIAEAPRVDGNQIAAAARRPEAVKSVLGFSDNLLPVALEMTRKDHVEMAALLPIIAVVFTVGGPVVYEETDVPAGNAGARTAWHTHPLGQTLMVTVGCGWVQCEGGPEYGEHSVSVAIDKTALIPRS